jgi:hypothetical protein
MATSDLLNELSKDTFRVDPELEKKLCSAVAVQLEDQSGDISGLAVKWCVMVPRTSLGINILVGLAAVSDLKIPRD